MDMGSVIHKMTSPFLSAFFDLFKTILLVPLLLLLIFPFFHLFRKLWLKNRKKEIRID